MKRKLVQQGASTLMVSLPTKWVRSHKLSKGSQVDILEVGDRLSVSSVVHDSFLCAKVDLSGFSPLINRAIITHYVKGYDELHISFDNRKDFREVKKHVIDELLGFEIISQDSLSMLIRDVTAGSREDLDALIQRVCTLLDAMAEELVSVIKNGEDPSLVIDIDSGVNKFCHFCLRLLSKQGHPNPSMVVPLFSVVERLEQIGDKYKDLARMHASKHRFTKNQIAVVSLLRENVSLFGSLLKSFDKDKVVRFSKNFELIKDKIRSKDAVDVLLNQLNEIIIRMNNSLLLTVF